MHAPTHQGRAPVVLVSLADDHARAATVGALEARYAPDYRIVEAVSAADAALLLVTVAAEGEEVAIVLADHAELPGSEAHLFRVARRLFPDVRRALVIECRARRRGIEMHQIPPPFVG